MQTKQTENTNIEERFGQAKLIQINKNRASKKKNLIDCLTTTFKEARENDN